MELASPVLGLGLFIGRPPDGRRQIISFTIVALSELFVPPSVFRHERSCESIERGGTFVAV